MMGGGWRTGGGLSNHDHGAGLTSGEAVGRESQVAEHFQEGFGQAARVSLSLSCENGSALGPPPSKVIGWEALWAAWPWCGRAGDPQSICPLSAHFHVRCTNLGGTSGGLGLGAPRPPLLQLLTQHALTEPQQALTEHPLRVQSALSPCGCSCDFSMRGVHLEHRFSTGVQLWPQGTLSRAWRPFQTP